MNSCEPYQEMISRLVDGEISREEHAALMAHMNTCSRCNAMYAVFHDLSDILSEEPEPLPEGLHESIMAGVRRSEMLKKNRRMRSLGLRTALSAAACALLVLFAASGFGPGRRAEDVSIRTQEAAGQLYQAPAEDVAAPPALTPAPLPAQTQTPVSAPARPAAPTEMPAVPVTPDAYLSAGYSVNEPQNHLQPEQNFSYQYVAPASEPVTAQSPAPAAFQFSEPAPFVPQTPPPAAQSAETEEIQAPAPAAEAEAELPYAARYSESTLTTAQNAALETAEITAETSENTAPLARKRSAPEMPASEESEEPANTEEAPEMFSLITGLEALFDSAGPEATDNDGDTDAENALPEDVLSENVFPEDTFSENAFPEDTFPENALPENALSENAIPENAFSENAFPEDTFSENALPENVFSENMLPENVPPEILAPDPASVPPVLSAGIAPEEQSFRIYGGEWHARLRALLGDSESALPQEAELTRVVHVTLCPDDAYGSEETLQINIYDDFVYYVYSAEGGVRSCRADCSLRELDAFLKIASEAAVPSPTPTADPYSGDAATE